MSQLEVGIAEDLASGRAGWRPDPTGRHALRYHDGSSWTSYVSTGDRRGVDPVALTSLSSSGRRAGLRRSGTSRSSIAAATRGLAANHLARARVETWLEARGSSPAEASRRYFGPLVRLAAGYLETGSTSYADVYLDERARYIPDRPTPEDVDELTDIFAKDRDVLAIAFGEESAARVAALDALLLAPPDGPAFGAVLVGDCVMTEVRAFLNGRARRSSFPLRVEHRYMSAGLGVGLAPPADLVQGVSGDDVDVVALSFLTFEGIGPYRALLSEADGLSAAEIDSRVAAVLALIRSYVETLRAASNRPILLHGVCGLPLEKTRAFAPWLAPMTNGRRDAVARVDEQLRELAEHTENTIFIDERSLTENRLRPASRRTFPRTLTHNGLFHTSAFGEVVAERYFAAFAAQRRLAKAKVLAIDLDNTLWQGVMAEGAVLHDVESQRLLRSLREAGMLLITTTKNDESSIRWDELALDPDDFVLHKIGWGQKAQSIEEAASQLDLGLDSFVLVDDNDVERALVSQQLPAVTVLDSRDPRTWEALGFLLEFPNTRRTDEARRRTDLYREAAVRREAMASAFDYPTMMAGLDLRVDFWAARKPDVERLHELLQRTNQFNTTTRRLPVEELQGMVDRGEVYAASLEDKFGKLGIVGAVLVRRDGDDLVFDDVVMSCRAMGFGLEHVMLRSTMDAEAGWSRAIGLFVPTGRNGPAADLFASAGFRADGEGRWVIEREGALPEHPPWIALHAS